MAKYITWPARPPVINILIVILIAKKIYKEIGNKSPILELTQDQAKILEINLSKKGDYKCFVVMRCWHPRASDIIKKVREYNPEEIILLPLYPQYSASTSGSSIKEWNNLCKKENYKIKKRLSTALL